MSASPVLDLGLLTSFVAPGAFTRIDPAVEGALAPLPEVRERVAGCVSFCYSVGAGDHANGAKGPIDVGQRRKYLRAALAEFASMEDAAAVDFQRHGPKVAPRMSDMLDPRVHVVRLLRNANIHLSATVLDHARRAASWDGPAGPQEFEYLLVLAKDVGASIHAVQSATRYPASDLAAMTTWLDAEQREWGIHHVVLRCAELYASHLAAAI